MGLETFSPAHDTEFQNMGKELRKANAEDKKAVTKQGRGLTTAIVKGTAQRRPNANYSNAMTGWVTDMRGRFKGCTVRRTVRSVDNNGKRISGLEPFEEHRLLLPLYPPEIANLDAIAAESSRAARSAAGQVSLNFPDISGVFSNSKQTVL